MGAEAEHGGLPELGRQWCESRRPGQLEFMGQRRELHRKRSTDICRGVGLISQQSAHPHTPVRS